MPLQSESLDTSAIERNIGKKQSKHWLKARSIYSMYGIPDLAELQILFYTGRLLHLRMSLLSGSEFRGVPWSQRMLEWDRVRRSLGCWWTELVYKGFDVRKNFTLARCLSQAPTESDPQSGSPACSSEAECKTRQIGGYTLFTEEVKPAKSSTETGTVNETGRGPETGPVPSAQHGNLESRASALLREGFEQRHPGWKSALRTALKDSPLQRALRKNQEALERYMTGKPIADAADLKLYGEMAVPGEAVAARAEDKAAFTELLTSEGVSMKGIAVTTYEVFDGLSYDEVPKYFMKSAYAKTKTYIDHLVDACMQLLVNNARRAAVTTMFPRISEAKISEAIRTQTLPAN